MHLLFHRASTTAFIVPWAGFANIQYAYPSAELHFASKATGRKSAWRAGMRLNALFYFRRT